MYRCFAYSKFCYVQLAVYITICFIETVVYIKFCFIGIATQFNRRLYTAPIVDLTGSICV